MFTPLLKKLVVFENMEEICRWDFFCRHDFTPATVSIKCFYRWRAPRLTGLTILYLSIVHFDIYS